MNLNVLENINQEGVRQLAKSYNPLSYYLDLLKILKEVYPDEMLDTLTKYQLHKLLNDILVKNHDGEELFKYKLWQLYLNESDIVGAFETKVNTSRVDFLTINGHTTSFEIKTKLDNLYKLSKQCSDYLQVFEYNYVVVAECHLQKTKEIIPESFGIWIHVDDRYECYKMASLNDQIRPNSQLELLTKKELRENFPSSEGLVGQILSLYTASQISFQFKLALKKRYMKRWKFTVAHQSDIFHMDVQFFFNKNIHPNHIYFL